MQGHIAHLHIHEELVLWGWPKPAFYNLALATDHSNPNNAANITTGLWHREGTQSRSFAGNWDMS